MFSVNKKTIDICSRMSFSCPSQTALTDAELNQSFGNGVIQGLLPSSPNGSSERDENGMLNQTALGGILKSLKSSGIIPSTNDAEKYPEKVNLLIKNVQSEYCFYESRYKYALQKLFDAIRQGYLNNSGEVQAVVQKYLAATQALNQRLNDLTQIINGVTDDMLSTTNMLEDEIRAFNNQIKQVQQKLDAQNKVISSSDATTKLNKQMVKFTEEKAKYTNNLLTMYSFLNIVALGLLVYVYKSSSD